MVHDIRVMQGNHSFKDSKGVPLPAIELNDLPLRHAPLRSAQQAMAKGVLGWKANVARKVNLGSSAFQWKRLHDLYEKCGPSMDPEALAGEAMAYAQNGHPEFWRDNAEPTQFRIVSERHYSDGSFATLENLLKPGDVASAFKPLEYKMPPPQSQAIGEIEIENAFNDAWHWEHLFVDVAPARFIVEQFEPDSVLDIGCGNGAYLDVMKFFGVVDVLGVDGVNRHSTVLPAAEYRMEDLQEPLDLGRTFDVVICLETVEHLRPNSTATCFDSIARHAKDLIVFSMAEPGQPSNGHINCMTIAEVLDEWALRGWMPDVPLSLGLRAISTMSWFRRNLLILKPQSYFATNHSDSALRRIGSLEYNWYGQAAAIRRAPFLEDWISHEHGYAAP